MSTEVITNKAIICEEPDTRLAVSYYAATNVWEVHYYGPAHSFRGHGESEAKARGALRTRLAYEGIQIPAAL